MFPFPSGNATPPISPDPDGSDPKMLPMGNHYRTRRHRQKPQNDQDQTYDGMRGWPLLAAASLLLAGLAATQGYVSFHQQFLFDLAAKPGQMVASQLEAFGLDAAAVVFAILGIALARLGRPARIERVLVAACSLGSGMMNLLGANLASPRSIAVYVMPPVLFATGADRLIAVVRRSALGPAADDEERRSAWRAVGMAVLYALRFVLAPPSTAVGLRRLVLAAAPLSAAGEPAVAAAEPASQAAGAAPAQPGFAQARPPVHQSPASPPPAIGSATESATPPATESTESAIVADPPPAIESATESATIPPASPPLDPPLEDPEPPPAGQRRPARQSASDADVIAARRAYRKSVLAGKPLSARALAARFPGRGRDWAASRITEEDSELAKAKAQ